jgi:hypothetical protein
MYAHPMKREVIDWKKRAVRKRANATGHAIRLDGSEVRVLVSNLNYDGCQVLSDTDLEIGETLTLRLPGLGQLRAQVRWADRERAGLRFLLGGSIDERRSRIGV